jgi:hypothetical protein
MISSGTSKFAKTFCTSSRSSSASTSLRTAPAAFSSPSSTCIDGMKDASAES